MSFIDDAGNEETLTGAATDTIVTWSATLTVGEDTSVIPKASGYSARGMDGTLSTDTFTRGGRTYRVRVLIHQSDGLVLVVDRKLQADFTLGIGDAQYERRDGSRPSTMFTDAYWWEAPNLNWSSGDVMEVSLTLASGSDASLPELPLAPPTAYFRLMPETHNGVDPFTFRLHFTEVIATDPETLRDHSLDVTGGSVITAGKVGDSGRIWEITVAPASTRDVTIALPADRGCEVPGAACTADGRQLHNRPEFTVAGPEPVSEQPPDGEGPPADELTAVWSATMTVEWVYQGYGYYSTDTKKAGSLTPASFEVDGTTYTVKMVETQGWWMYIGVDRELPFDFVLELDGTRFASDDASFNSYSYGNIYRWEGTGLSLSDGNTVEVRLLRALEDETAVNSAATGAPVISGTAQVGEALTADTSGIEDADGLSNVQYEYQWLADDTEVAGATGSTYTLADADEGKTVKVQVSFTDDAGHDETLTSAATGAVAAKPNSPATGTPTISGATQVGETLTAEKSGIADADGLENATFSYQWLADDGSIGGATGSSYTPTDADESKAIKVKVSFTDDASNEETLTSAATDAVAAKPNSPATGVPTISGTAQVGETLTAGTSGIADDDGLDNVSYSYQWLADDAETAGATGSTYTLVDADAGKSISVRVSFSDDAGNEETLTSGATDAVAAPEPPAEPTGLSATANPRPGGADLGRPQ